MSSTFTGLSRRQTRWTVRLSDRVARLFIVVGGIGTIIAVSTVCLFLAYVAAPLFFTPESGRLQTSAAPWASPAPRNLGLDDEQRIGWTLADDGQLAVVRADGRDAGQVIDQFHPASPRRVTASAISPAGGDVALGLDDGSVQLGRITTSRQVIPAQGLPPTTLAGLDREAIVPHERGVVERTAAGQLRWHKVEARFEPPLEPISPAPITLVDQSVRSTGRIIATWSDQGELVVRSLRQQRSLSSGKLTFTSRHVVLPNPRPRVAQPPAFLLLSGVGDSLFVAWRDGHLARFDLRNLSKPELAEEVDLLAEPEATLTALRFMVGKTTLVAGDSLGRIRGWFAVRQPASPTIDGLTMVAAHELPAGPDAVTALAPSGRSRMLAAGYADGTLRLFYMTSRKLLLESHAGQGPGALALSPQDSGLWAVLPGTLCHWRFRVPHPEASLASLVLPVWYEGHPRPTTTWQSTGGSDDFEPKLGLWPLVFGTLKATFYSLLFGVPLALLAAVYTSEFLHPRGKSWVKPSIELMAGLPSVVLGFLAALVFAPVVERMLPALLAMLVTVPLAFLVAALVWQLLPQPLLLSLRRWRFAFIGLALPLGPLGGLLLAPLVENTLFAGNIKAWLDGRAGGPAGGWMLFLLPVCSAAAIWIVGSHVNPPLRRLAGQWSRLRYGLVDAGVYLGAVAGTVALAWLLAVALGLVGLDPRGSLLDTYEQRNALIVGFVMGFAIIPIIYTIAEDALSTVPQHLRSASLGAGATNWQTAVRIIIPTAMSGLFSAVMVGMGRAVGETMIVLMAAGNTPITDVNIFNGFRTLPANLAVELPEAVRNSTHYRTLFLSALVLFAMTFVLNTAAEVVRQRYRKRAFQL